MSYIERDVSTAAISTLLFRIDGLIDKMKAASSTNEHGHRTGNVLQLLGWIPALKAMCQAAYALHEMDGNESANNATRDWGVDGLFDNHTEGQIIQAIACKAKSELLIDVTLNGEMCLRSYNGATGTKWRGFVKCNTVGDLTKYTQEEFMRGAKFGIKSLLEIDAVLKKRGLSFKKGGRDFIAEVKIKSDQSSATTGC